MIEFAGSDINSVYLNALLFSINPKYRPASSRNGDVYDMGPAYFEFTQPFNQLLLLRNRKFNPYFALVESAWVLSGQNELSSLKSVIDNYDQFTDDGTTLNGAYGYRMKSFFEIDQLEAVINLLTADPNTRRAVITLYSPNDLINNQSKDIPCNTTLFFKKRDNKLDITVINRSNDLFLGIPYNVFMFNVIQKFVAYKIDLEIGVQRHFSDSLHLYQHDIDKVKKIIKTNSNKEIEMWKSSLSNTNDIDEFIIKRHNEIYKLDIENINDPYCRNIVYFFLEYKQQKNPNTLVQSLPNDIFGFCAYLWIKSYCQKKLTETVFDKIYGDFE